MIVQIESMEAQGLMKPERLAILDTGCAGSVAGREWVEDHIRNLCPKDKRTVRRTQGQANFDFGNGSNLKSQERVVMPVYYANKKDLMVVDMLDAGIPLLISLPEMKKTRMIIYTSTDTANILGQNFELVSNLQRLLGAAQTAFCYLRPFPLAA